jgi:hypothetical protein
MHCDILHSSQALCEGSLLKALAPVTSMTGISRAVTTRCSTNGNNCAILRGQRRTCVTDPPGCHWERQANPESKRPNCDRHCDTGRANCDGVATSNDLGKTKTFTIEMVLCIVTGPDGWRNGRPWRDVAQRDAPHRPAFRQAIASFIWGFCVTVTEPHGVS